MQEVLPHDCGTARSTVQSLPTAGVGAAASWDRPDVNMFICLKISLSHTQTTAELGQGNSSVSPSVSRSALVLGNWEEGIKSQSLSENQWPSPE